jgi:hypothetical protein
MSGLDAVRLVAGIRRWPRLWLAIASVLLMSAPAPASAASAPFRDGLLIVVSGLPLAPASVTLSFDHGRASVLSQHVQAEPSLTSSPLSWGAYQLARALMGSAFKPCSLRPWLGFQWVLRY